MTTLGFDRPLYILPFGHRAFFQKMFGWDGELTPSQTEEIAAAKRVVYDAFRSAIRSGVPKAKAGILVDEQFGAAILRDATSPVARRKKAGRTNSIWNADETSRTTSTPSTQRSVKCWCDTTPKVTPNSTGAKPFA